MTMSIEEARDVVAEALAEVAPDVDLATGWSSSLTTGLDLDSMDVLSLLAGIEARTGHSVPDGVVRPSWTPAELATYLTTS